MNLELEESDRQLVLLALAVLSLENPGFDYALNEVAKRIDNVEKDRALMYDGFRELRKDNPAGGTERPLLMQLRSLLAGDYEGLKTRVQPDWCRKLPFQQQSVLFLAARGPDGVPKVHPCKPICIAYRATVFKAAYYGRLLKWGEKADTFMSLDVFADDGMWLHAMKAFFDHHDELPKHYLAHLMHGAQILGYKHPDERFRKRWSEFYLKMVESLHLNPETEEQMDKRLGDWGQEHWD